MAAPSNHLLGIAPNMYRHFAVITVAISSVIALFANGDAQEAIAKTELHGQKQAAMVRNGKATLVDNRTGQSRSGGSDAAFTGQFGAPMDGSAGITGNSGVIPATIAVAPAPIVIEVDQAALARMTPQQRSAYLRKLEDERKRRLAEGPAAPTPDQIRALAAQSAARSGSDEID